MFKQCMEDVVFFAAKVTELNKIKIGAVNYKNTKPLLLGIKKSGLMQKIELTEDYPANVAKALLENKIDIGLVPVAILPQLNNYYIVSDYCIGATQAVASVCLFSEVPIEKIETVILDYQSRTSVNLCKILMKYYWKKEVTYIAANEDFLQQINGTTAAVVIGDRALELSKNNTYVYDLAEAWINFTHKPFVFAAWIANKPINEDFIDAFNKANAYGLKHLEEVLQENPYTAYNLAEYYTKNISYHLDKQKLEGLYLYLDYLKKL